MSQTLSFLAFKTFINRCFTRFGIYVLHVLNRNIMSSKNKTATFVASAYEFAAEKELRKRWDSLRTQFARYKKLAPLQKTGRQQWILSQLQFLDPHTKTKESTSSLTVLVSELPCLEPAGFFFYFCHQIFMRLDCDQIVFHFLLHQKGYFKHLNEAAAFELGLVDVM